MKIKDTHDIVLYYLNKDQNSYVSHEEIDMVLDKAQLVLFNQYHTNPKIPAQAQASLYGESQRIDDALSVFKAKMTFNAGASPSGVVTLPSDYMHLLSMYTTVYNNSLGRNVYSSVQVLSEDELIERLESQVIPVTAEDPIAIMNSANKIQMFPETGTNGGVYYFRRPIKPIFGYTQSSGSRTIVHDPTAYDASTNTDGSIDLEWRDVDVNNIISIALSYYGLSMSSTEIMQFAELKTQTGQ